MSLHRRVRKIETLMGRRAPCSRCNGYGGPWIVVWMEGDPEPPMTGCPACGRPARAVTTVIIESGLERAREPVTEEFGGTIVSVAAARYGSG